MNRSYLLLLVAIAFALTSTALLAIHLFTPFSHSSYANIPSGAVSTGTSLFNASGMLAAQESTLQLFLATTPILSTISWTVVGIAGVWIWKGKTKSRWQKLGFDSNTFELFVKMKGAKTRMYLLEALSLPKDRLQLAEELEIDWKAVDYQITLLSKYGLVHEQQAFGRVRMYRLTTLGETLLKLLREFNREIEERAEPISNIERSRAST